MVCISETLLSGHCAAAQTVDFDAGWTEDDTELLPKHTCKSYKNVPDSVKGQLYFFKCIFRMERPAFT